MNIFEKLNIDSDLKDDLKFKFCIAAISIGTCALMCCPAPQPSLVGLNRMAGLNKVYKAEVSQEKCGRPNSLDLSIKSAVSPR